jgi:CO dehydrogenase/acetyl-CoA synthase alpha subunit
LFRLDASYWKYKQKLCCTVSSLCKNEIKTNISDLDIKSATLPGGMFQVMVIAESINKSDSDKEWKRNGNGKIITGNKVAFLHYHPGDF